jgi:acyl-CoA reductase-like NAD-dependent aldehyde dehydrogenase
VFGPVISHAAADRILGVIEQAVGERSGDLIVGGRRLGCELAAGYYIQPTVFAGVDNASALAQTETFGPVVSVMKFGDEDQHLQRYLAARAIRRLQAEWLRPHRRAGGPARIPANQEHPHRNALN